jgi:ATP-binding cassette subfamily C (CFTR/MRP) protein 1
MMFGKLIGYRSTQEKIVDKRVRLLTEVIGHIRSVKLYAYERVFSDKELSKLKKFGFVRAMIMSTFNFLPILAAVGE